MTKPRNILMPAGSTGTFHAVSRCVSREFLLERDERCERLTQGLARWLTHVGLDLHAYAITSNHVYLVLRLRPDRVAETVGGSPLPCDLDARSFFVAHDASGRQVAASKRSPIPAGLVGSLDRLGFTAEAWLGAMARGGAMLGTALGAPANRHSFAARAGMNWCADSSGLWVA